jgi:RimJ/RimL family protein N-acetyltransferase
VGLAGRSPESATDLFTRTRDILEPTVDALETSGVRRYVVGVIPALAARAPELAFFLKRREGQRCFLLTGRDDPGRWAAVAAESLLRAESAAAMIPWEPEPPRIETDRLILTFATRAQTAGYYRSIVGTDIFDMLVWDGPKEEAELHDWALKMRRQFAHGHGAGFAVIEKKTDRQIGAIGGHPLPRNTGRWTIGYSLSPDAHGKGYGTESVGALVDYLFRERGAAKLDAEVYTINPASRRLLEKLGFDLEGTMIMGQAKAGGRRDLWAFGITRERWLERS